MKTTSIVLTFFLIFSSCYSYRSFDPEEYAEATKGGNNLSSTPTPTKISRKEINSVRGGGTPVKVLKEEDILAERIKERDAKKDLPKIDPSTIRITDIIKENQFYKIGVEGKEYTIEAKQWKADTLYSIVKGSPKKELKFHKDQILLSEIKVRKFSKGKSDALTVAAYALGGVGLFLLLK